MWMWVCPHARTLFQKDKEFRKLCRIRDESGMDVGHDRRQNEMTPVVILKEDSARAIG